MNGQRLYFDVQPVLIDGRVLLPLRTIFEQLGASVEWDGTEKKLPAPETALSLNYG